MTFTAQLKAALLKGATTKYDKAGEQIDTPAILVVQLEVEAPSAEVLALVGRLASDGRQVEVELTAHQMGF